MQLLPSLNSLTPQECLYISKSPHSVSHKVNVLEESYEVFIFPASPCAKSMNHCSGAGAEIVGYFSQSDILAFLAGHCAWEDIFSFNLLLLTWDLCPTCKLEQGQLWLHYFWSAVVVVDLCPMSSGCVEEDNPTFSATLAWNRVL